MTTTDSVVYIAGPMTGYPDFNYPAFHAAEQVLSNDGLCTVINPARNHGGRQDLDRDRYLRTALTQVMESDMIVVLDGWEDSRGAVLEVHTALELDTPVFELGCVIDPHWEDECRIIREGNDLLYGCPGGDGTDIVKDPTETHEPARARLLADAQRLICGDRNAQYGDPYDDFARTAGALNALGYQAPGGAPLSPSDVALFQIQVKLSRIISTKTKMDSWTDIAGYAACGYEVATREDQ